MLFFLFCHYEESDLNLNGTKRGWVGDSGPPLHLTAIKKSKDQITWIKLKSPPQRFASIGTNCIKKLERRGKSTDWKISFFPITNFLILFCGSVCYLWLWQCELIWRSALDWWPKWGKILTHYVLKWANINDVTKFWKNIRIRGKLCG